MLFIYDDYNNKEIFISSFCSTGWLLMDKSMEFGIVIVSSASSVKHSKYFFTVYHKHNFFWTIITFRFNNLMRMQISKWTFYFAPSVSWIALASRVNTFQPLLRFLWVHFLGKNTGTLICRNIVTQNSLVMYSETY